MLFKNQTRNNKLIKTFDVEDQHGDGFIGDMFRGARNLGRKAACPKETRPLFAGENHAPCANFSGPGTNVEARLRRGDKPSGPIDHAAMRHDISYKILVYSKVRNNKICLALKICILVAILG